MAEKSLLFSDISHDLEEKSPKVVISAKKPVGNLQQADNMKFDQGFEAFKSIQPHLDAKCEPQMTNTNAFKILPQPPPMNALNGMMLKKPRGKYVVPKEIAASTTNNASFSSNLLPNNFVPPSHPFIPSNVFIPPAPVLGASNFPISSSLVNLPSAPMPPMPNQNISNVKPPTTFYQPSQEKNATIPASFDRIATNPPILEQDYRPVIAHWFYLEGNPPTWKPFTFVDSLDLEHAFQNSSEKDIWTNGGRFNSWMKKRERVPVYWEAVPSPIRRCTWFKKEYTELLPIPYEEEIAQNLEDQYREASLSGTWHRQVELENGERIMINSPYSIHHYKIQGSADAPISDTHYPVTVKRGCDDFDIKDGEPEQVDHLLFLIHGIGSVCDLTFRSVEEVVNDFRSMGEDLLCSHFKEARENGKVGRVEILPISWHKALHGDATGLDKKLTQITLRSIPKFREFINDTLLDILFFTSPVYCQHIMDTVASEIERLLRLFKTRNAKFDGKISLGGHSLGSVICFDLLMHQNPKNDLNEIKTASISLKNLNIDNASLNSAAMFSCSPDVNTDDMNDLFFKTTPPKRKVSNVHGKVVDYDAFGEPTDSNLQENFTEDMKNIKDKDIENSLGKAPQNDFTQDVKCQDEEYVRKTSTPEIKIPEGPKDHLNLPYRRTRNLSQSVDFEIGPAGTGQPTIAYSQLSFHPEILFLMGSPVGMFLAVRGIDNLGPDFQLPTCKKVFNIFHPYDPVAYRVESLIDPKFGDLRPVLIPHHKGRKRFHLELKDTIERVSSEFKNKIVGSLQMTWNKFVQIYSGAQGDAVESNSSNTYASEPSSESFIPETETVYPEIFGRLNSGKRIDYVLQEKPYESLTEYFFALQAHVNYWCSEDTLLMILKEIYKLDNIESDDETFHQHNINEVAKSLQFPFNTVPLQPQYTQSNIAHSALNSEPATLPRYPVSEEPAAAIPLINIQQANVISTPNVQQSSFNNSNRVKALRGRPVFDPSSTIPTVMGMDPTVTPEVKNLPPPPKMNSVNFSFKNKK